MKSLVTKPTEKSAVGWLARKHNREKNESFQQKFISQIFQSDKGK
jgi:hypothetical protein